MYRNSPPKFGSFKRDDQIPIIVNESIEDDVLAYEQHATEGNF